MRFALDRTLQQVAQFPYSGSWCGRRYADLRDMPEMYRVITVSDMVLFYQVLENERTILFVHMQTTTMDAPRPEMLSQ